MQLPGKHALFLLLPWQYQGTPEQAFLHLGKVPQGPQLAVSGAGPHQVDYFIPHPLEGSASLNHRNKEALIFRSLQLFLAFFFTEIPQIEHPGSYRVCSISMGLATGSPTKQRK